MRDPAQIAVFVARHLERTAAEDVDLDAGETLDCAGLGCLDDVLVR